MLKVFLVAYSEAAEQSGVNLWGEDQVLPPTKSSNSILQLVDILPKEEVERKVLNLMNFVYGKSDSKMMAKMLVPVELSERAKCKQSNLIMRKRSTKCGHNSVPRSGGIWTHVHDGSER